jgi:glycosyltransferase involved in cell wall biosynthesis
MIKIVFFIKSISGGGAEKVFKNLSEYFAKHYKVILLLKRNNEITFDKKFLNVISLKHYFKFNNIIAFRKMLLIEKPDIIVSALAFANLLSLTVRILFGIKDTKFITSFHANLETPDSFIINTILKSVISLYRRSDYIITSSKGVEIQLRKRLDKYDRIRTIYNPVYSNSSISLSEETLPHNKYTSGRYIVSIGRLQKYKRFDILIKAFRKVRDEYDIKMIILGEGKERKSLEFLIEELNLKEEIYLPGYVDNVYNYIKNSLMLVLTSEYEGFGNVLVEAMSVGRSVVSTNCKFGPSEILNNGKYGYLTDINNINDISKKIKLCLEKPLPEKLLIERAQVFSIQHIQKYYVELFNLLTKN